MNQIPFLGLKTPLEATEYQFYVQTHSVLAKTIKTCLISLYLSFSFCQLGIKMFVTYKHLEILGNRGTEKNTKGTTVREGGKEGGREEQLKLGRYVSSCNSCQSRSHRHSLKAT